MMTLPCFRIKCVTCTHSEIAPRGNATLDRPLQSQPPEYAKSPQLSPPSEFYELNEFYEFYATHFPSNSIAPTVIPSTPIRIVASRSGRYSGECTPGNLGPPFLLAATFSRSTLPTRIIKIGTRGSVRPYMPKSSPPMTGSR